MPSVPVLQQIIKIIFHAIIVSLEGGQVTVPVHKERRGDEGVRGVSNATSRGREADPYQGVS